MGLAAMVGLVVEQMRQDVLERLLMRDGRASCGLREGLFLVAVDKARKALALRHPGRG